MKVGRLKRIIENCNDNCEIVIFVTSEGVSGKKKTQYRPFRNIRANIFNKGSLEEELHFDISVNTEYKSIHFPNNLSEEAVALLKERRTMLLEDLEDIEKELGGFK